MDKEYLLTFENSHKAIDAESIMKRNNLYMVIMPTPTVITRSCGICIKFTEKELDKVKILIESDSIKVKNTLLKTGRNYEVIEL
jgi:hypothetical protein